MADDINIPGGGQPINVTGPGGLIAPLYTERRMKCFNVTQGDLSSLSLANWLVTGCAAFSSFCFSQALAVYTNAAFVEKFTAAGEMLAYFAVPTFSILGIFGAVGAVCAYFWKASHWKIIEQESFDRNDRQ